MKTGKPTSLLPLGLALALTVACTSGAPAPTPAAKRVYPKAPTSGQVDDYHGTKVADPYRPLENPDAPESRTWIEAENALTEDYLKQIPERAKIRERLTKLWNYERYTTPHREGGRLFYSKNDGLQNQSVLYVVDKPGAEPRVLLDPNGFSKDGTVALSGTRVSDDGSLMAFGVAAAGSDWNEWRVLDVASGKETGDILKWIKFSNASWTKDGKGFFYTRYDEPPAGHELDALSKSPKVHYHRIGTKQSEDALVFSRPDEPELGLNAVVSDDGRWLLMYQRKGTDRRNRLWYKDLTKPDSDFVKLFDTPDASYQFVDSDGSTFLIRTDKDAPRRRIAAIDVAAASPALKDVIPQSEAVLESVNVVGGKLAVTILKDATERARVYALDGKLEKEIELPTLGRLGQGSFSGKRADMETYYSFTSFTYPTTIFRYDFKTGKSEIFRQPKVDFDPAAFETKQVFYPSKDGTKIPLFLVSKKGMKQDGHEPDVPLRLRRLQHLRDAGVLGEEPRVHGDGRPLRPRVPARGRRVRRGVAPRRHARKEAERLRRLRGGGGVAHQEQVHVCQEASLHRRRLERGPSRGRHPEPAPRPLRRGRPAGRRHGHAPLPQVHDRLGLGVGLRLGRQARPVQVHLRLLAAAQHQARHEVPAGPRHDRRP